MTSNPREVLRHLGLQALGWVVLSALVHSARASMWADFLGATPIEVAGRALLWAAIGLALSGALLVPYRLLVAQAPPTLVRLLVLGGLCVAAGLAFAAIADLTNWPLPPPPSPRRHEPSLWFEALTPTLAMLALTALELVWDAMNRWRVERERALDAERLAVEARLAMLRYELNPHFLFNALNSVIGVIDESPPRAQEMVRQLSDLLRHTLHGPENQTTLGDEVRTARLYLDIEKVRFEERLQVQVDVPPEAESFRVPPLLLQPLVENAVKHGMDEHPLRIAIRARVDGPRLTVTVANSGHLGTPSPQGVGLRNLRDRLDHQHPGAHRFDLAQEGDEVVATVVLDAPRKGQAA